MRRFLETLAEQDERHDGGGRWIGTGGHSPFGHGGEHPTGIRVGGSAEEPLGDEGRRGAPLQGLPHRLDARPAPDEGGAQAPAPPHALRARRPSSTSTTPSTRPARTRGEIELVFRRRAPQQRAAAAADGRGRHDGSVLRAGEPAADGAARGARPARASRPTTSTTASTSASARTADCTCDDADADRRPPAPPRRALEGR